MIDHSPLLSFLEQSKFKSWLPKLQEQIATVYDQHGDVPRWKACLHSLPNIPVDHIQLNSKAVGFEPASPLSQDEFNTFSELLQQFHPWRKGPFSLAGVEIDTEWRSDLKWDRLEKKIQPLQDRLVLDVGCGNGYHCWRMAGLGARQVIGIDPFLLYIAQFAVLNHFLKIDAVDVLPLTLEDMPLQLPYFDTVFSMGVMSHRRSPMDHLVALREKLRSGGELVLETLVIDGGAGEVLVPEGRYAKMHNVWFLPSCLTLEGWLRRCGFTNVRTINMTRTTSEEQRRTDWMTFESLPDFLDPDDEMKTIEGYSAPTRAILLAEKK